MPSEEATSDGDGGRTVVVGVKLDARSRELLTWSLVKVAEPGDHVIALHVINTMPGLSLSLSLSLSLVLIFFFNLIFHFLCYSRYGIASFSCKYFRFRSFRLRRFLQFKTGSS